MSDDTLQVTDIRPGTGKAVVKGALITTQYTGTLVDGTVFDSSLARGKPFQCVIGTGRVIKGWDQGLMGMQVGGRAPVVRAGAPGLRRALDGRAYQTP